MANYNYVVTSKFRPLSYDEMIKPLQQQTDLHNMYEDAYAELATKADVLKERAKNEDNSAWSKKYTEYANALEQSVNELATRGLNSMSRRAVNEARRRYASDIVPIQEAITKQAEIAKIQQSANPALRMQYSEMPSIDALIVNPNLSPISYSGAAVEKSASEMANAAASRRASSGLRQYSQYWLQEFNRTGFNANTVDRFLSDAESVPELNDIITRVQNQFGNFEGMNNAQKDQLNAEIISGILKGATYKQQANYTQDPIALKNWEFEENDRRTKEKALQEVIGRIDPVDFHLELRNKNIQDLVDKGVLIKGPNGRVTLNQKINDNIVYFNTLTSAHPKLREKLLNMSPKELNNYLNTTDEIKSDIIKNDLKNLLLSEATVDVQNPWSPSRRTTTTLKDSKVRDLLKYTYNDLKSSGKDFKFTAQEIEALYNDKAPISIMSQVGFRMTPANPKDVKLALVQNVATIGGVESLDIMEYKGDKGWVKSNESITTKELLKDDYTLINETVIPVSDDNYDVIAQVSNKDGEIINIRFPEGNSKNTILSPANNLSKLRQRYNESTTESDRLNNERLYKRFLGDMYYGLADYSRTTKTKSEEYDAVGTPLPPLPLLTNQ